MGPDASVTPELIQSQSFTSTFRGFDPAEVRSFLSRVATELRAWRERAEQLESAWHSAEERAARPPVLDEDTLMDAVGEETASILRAARAGAAEMRAKAAGESERILADARAESERLLADAQGEAERIRVAAEEASTRSAASAEDAAARLLSGARTDAAEILEKARIEAEALRKTAEKEHQLTIEGANTTRDRILEDLARRRRIATVQIEQLRAGRERLIESYAVVRRTLEEASSELSRADAEARAAATEVGRRLAHEPDQTVAEFLEHEPEPSILAETETAETDAGAAEADAAETEPVAAEAAPEPEPAGPEPEPVAAAAEAEPESEIAPEPEPEPAPVASESEPEPVPRSADESPAGPGDPPASAVDELFARIRANQGPDAAADTPTDETVTGESQTDDEPVEVTDATAGGEGEDEKDGARLSDADESLLQRRESAVVDLETTLTRRLKRALQDEQNDVLDRLRNLRGEPTAARLLPDGEAQTARYRDAARPLLLQAAQAGADFAVDTLGSTHAEDPADLDVDDLATDAGEGIVEPLRRRLEQAIAQSAGDDQAVLVESLGAAYREWKTQRIERLAGDVLSAAFSRGTWRAAPDGAVLRWIVEDTDGPCPDCDDDALAGELPKGEAFPTGQHHPPAHSGCRCLLVPSPPAT